MDLARLDELRQKLLNEKNFAPIWRYFLDHFSDTEFMSLGQGVTDEVIEMVLAEVAIQLYRKSQIISGIRLVRLAEQRFVHGAFSVDGRAGGLFYFEEPDAGLIVICEHPLSIQVQYCRFRLMPFRQRPQPSVN